MHQHLYGIYLTEDDTEANEALGAFIELWQNQEIAEFLPIIDALLEWADEIFNFHQANRITNGRLEGRMNKLESSSEPLTGSPTCSTYEPEPSSSVPEWHEHAEPGHPPHGTAKNQVISNETTPIGVG